MSQSIEIEQIEQAILELLKNNELDALSRYCNEQHPADLAEALETLELEEQTQLLKLMDLQPAAEVLSHLDEELRGKLMEGLEEERLTHILERLPLDDAADVVADLDEDRAFRVLAKMDVEDSEDIRDLLQYDEESAGGIMTSDVIALPASMTVGEVLEAFRGNWKSDSSNSSVRPEWETAYELIRQENIYSIYVVDDHNKLKGYVRLQDLIRSEPSLHLSDILERDFISVSTDEDQEAVAALAQKYDLVSIPVVDRIGRIAGRVTIDDLMDVVQEETTEDILKMAGTTEDELISRSAIRSLILRFPWLLAALGGLLLSSSVYRMFHSTLALVVQLAFFIPVIGGISGNTAVQAATIVVRGMAIGQIDRRDAARLVLKEIRVGLLLGTVFSIIVVLMAFWLTGEVRVAMIVGMAVLVAICWASLLGVLIPTLLSRLGKDPAVATGPVVTSMNDAVAACIYLSIATLMLKIMG